MATHGLLVKAADLEPVHARDSILKLTLIIIAKVNFQLIFIACLSIEMLKWEVS